MSVRSFGINIDKDGIECCWRSFTKHEFLTRISMKFPADTYDIKARYAPGLIVALPFLITFWTCFHNEAKALSGPLGGVISIIVWYLMSVSVRFCGKRIEQNLWITWGGAPSSILVLWSDKRLGVDLKIKYHEMAEKTLGMPMPNKALEQSNPQETADLIDQVFHRVKGILRQYDKDGLWSVANAEYGFARNLYGSRLIWLSICILMTTTSATLIYFSYSSLKLIGLTLNLLNLFCCVVVGWFVLPKLTKEIGFRYAEHAWESFFNIAEQKIK